MKGLLQIRARASKASELLIFGDIGDLGFEGTVKARDIVTQLSALKADTLLVRINSYGGRVDEGLAIFNALRAFPGTVTTRVEGMAASIASVIAMAGERVEMARGSMLMIHAASSFAGGNAADLQSAADSLEKTDQTLAEIYARQTGRTAEQELDLIKSTGDRWMTAEEAVEQGYADAIYDPDAQTASAAAPAYCDGLLHHLPTAGAYAGVITAHLARIRLPTAARAAATPPETCMNWKTLAQALGIKLADGADDSAARLAIAKHFTLTDAATDDEIAAAIAAAGDDGSVPPAAAGAPAQASAEQQRRTQIEELFAIAMQGRQDRPTLTAMRAQALIGADSVAEVRERLVAHLSGGAPVQGGAAISTASITQDQRDKTRAAATGWLLARASIIRAGSEEHRTVMAGNPFARMNYVDIARACLADIGVDTRRMNRLDVITAAITHSTSDFPNIFENALNKTLQRGYEKQQPTWRRFCKVGSLTDFRPHIRLNPGCIGDLQERGQNGEYKSLSMGDAERQLIQAVARGGILNLSREMLINDDVGIFTDVATAIGMAAARTLDKGVYALFAMNGGSGPTMTTIVNGVQAARTMFHADHGNIAAVAAVPTVDSIEAGRVQMGQHKDPSGNDYLDIRPDRWLGPQSVSGKARAVNTSTYDPDAANKLQRTNIVANLFNDIIDTPRLSGTAWYQLANPDMAPVIEVGFLDGMEIPQLEQKEAWTQAGMQWRVLHDWGAGGVGYVGINKNAGV